MKLSITKMFWLLVFLLGGIAQTAYAQLGGMRYSSLQYEIKSAQGSSYTVKFKIIQIWDGAAPQFNGKAKYIPGPGTSPTLVNEVYTGSIDYGSGSIGSIPLIYEEDLPGGLVKATAVTEYTYSLPGPYMVKLGPSLRRDDNLEDGNSNKLYRIVMDVDLKAGVGYKSPAINLPVPFTISRGVQSSFDLSNAVILDDNSDISNVNYSLPGAGETYLLGSAYPSFTTYALSNSNLGNLDYSTTATTALGDYATQIRVTDEQGGQAVVDFIITVDPCDATTTPNIINGPASGTIFTVNPGDQLTFAYNAETDNNNENVEFSVVGEPSFTVTNTSTAGTATTPGTANSSFDWTPTIADLGIRSVSFSAVNTTTGCVESRSITIRVTNTPFPEPTLIISDECSDDPTVNEWNIHNDENYDVLYSWQIMGSTQSGLGIAAAGSSGLQTFVVGVNDVLEITWYDKSGVNTDQETWNAGPCSCIEICPTTSSLCGGDPNAASSGDYKSYEFYFTDYPSAPVLGISSGNTTTVTTLGPDGIVDDGVTSTDGKTFDIHVSCSDPFTGGYGDKNGPTISDGVQVISYKIWKYKTNNPSPDKCCEGTPGSSTTSTGSANCIQTGDPYNPTDLGGAFIAPTSDYYSFTFEFQPVDASGNDVGSPFTYNGISTTGNVATIDPLNNGVGFDVHVSCSDPFTGGYGVKDGPQMSDGVRVVSFNVWKYKVSGGVCTFDKTCSNAPSSNPGCIDPADPNQNVSYTQDYTSYVLYFDDGTTAIGTTTKKDVNIDFVNFLDVEVHIHCKEGFPNGYGDPGKGKKPKARNPQQALGHPKVLAYAIWEYKFDKKKGTCKDVKMCTGGEKTCVDQTLADIFVGTGKFSTSCTNKANPYINNILVSTTTLDFTVYPNPSNGLFTLSYELEEDADVSIMVTDLIGNVIISKSSSAEHGGHAEILDMSSANSGMYLLMVSIDGELFTEKVQVIK